MQPLARLGLIVGEISWKHGKCWMVEVIKSTNPSNVGLPNDLTHRSCSGSTTPAMYQKKFRSLVARILPGSFAQSVRHSANVFQTNSTGCLSESTCPVQLWLSWWESGTKHRQACQRTDYKLSRYIISVLCVLVSHGCIHMLISIYVDSRYLDLSLHWHVYRIHIYIGTCKTFPYYSSPGKVEKWCIVNVSDVSLFSSDFYCSIFLVVTIHMDFP